MALSIKRQRLIWKGCGHLLGLSPVAYLVWLATSGRLGFDPGKEMIHALGFSAIFLLIATLLVTPLRRFFPALAKVIWVRRLLGIWTFVWATLHVLAYGWFELGWNVSLLATEVVKRPYLWFGMVAWLLLLALTLTSTQNMRERLRRRWTRLHQGIYLIAVFAGIHYWWSLKVTNVSDLLWVAVLWGIVVLRWLPLTLRR